MTTLGVLLFIVFILLAIGLHEFGHFATAKAFGIKVERFFIGFGPKIWSTRRGETEYGIAALPLGGYVRIAGMNPFEEVPVEERPRTFKAKPAWQRAIVLAAGSLTHFVIAFVIVVGVLILAGLPELTTTVSEVSGVEGIVTPAQAAGFRPGDKIVAVGGERVREWLQIRDYIRSRPGSTVTFGVERNGVVRSLTATLAQQKPDGEKVGFLGVSTELVSPKRSLPSAITEGGALLARGVKDSLSALKRVFSPSTIGRLFVVASRNEPRRPDDPTTVVGAGRFAGDLARRGEFANIFLTIVGFNIFIGVANLLPLPPLDGGHLAVLGFEKISRREVDMRRLLPVSAFVVTVLVSLFVLLLYLDIVRPLPPLPG